MTQVQIQKLINNIGFKIHNLDGKVTESELIDLYNQLKVINDSIEGDNHPSFN